MTYYDDRGRPIHSYGKNDYLGTMDIVESQLDFTGKPVKTRTTHVRNGVTITTLDNFTYDHTGRPLSHTQCIGDESMGDHCPESGTLEEDLSLSGTVDNLREATNSITVTNATLSPGAHLRISNGSDRELIAFNDYDELGQLRNKKVGGTPGTDYDGTAGLQTVDYAYNVRGWLTSINNGAASGNDLFGFKLNYNTVEHGGTPLFNGNIAETSWATASTNNTSNPVSTNYRYLYDPLNRIISATDNTGNYNISGISYDKMGNIQTLTRNGWQNGSFVNMDVLDYDYDSGNKLLKVSDTGNDTYGFKDGTNTNDDFEYDENGNLKIDRNKGITSVAYNHLNLPVLVDFGSDNIQYVYAANGIKLKKTVNDNSSSISTEYSGKYIYKTVGGNNELQFIGHSEGYVTPDDGNGWQYVYNYKDHLGNVRLSYSDADGDGQITVSSDPMLTEIISEKNYYPFGMTHFGYNNVVSANENSQAEKYKYQGQELNESLGYNMYEFELRHYDATIGRFVTTDPYEQFDNPYLAMGNNPVVSFDPDGGYCYDINGNQIACPTDAGDFYDDYINSEDNHITILQEAGGTAEKRAPYITDYDYSGETIPGKLEEDLDFIFNGSDLYSLSVPKLPGTISTPELDRFMLILARDIEADPDAATDSAVDIVSAALPVVRIGKYVIPAKVFHRSTKPSVLKSVGKKVYERVVGRNPDIGVENGKIILKGTGINKGRTHRTDLDADDFLLE